MTSQILLALMIGAQSAMAAYNPPAAAIVRPGGSTAADNASITLPLNLSVTNTYTVSANGNGGGSVTVGNYNYFASWRDGGQWKVGQGRVAKCYDMNYVAAANAALQFGYATSSFADNSSTAPGGALCYSGVACGTSSIIGSRVFQTGSNLAKVALVFDASSSGANRDIFPFWRSNTNNTFQLDLFCYEQVP